MVSKSAPCGAGPNSLCGQLWNFWITYSSFCRPSLQSHGIQLITTRRIQVACIQYRLVAILLGDSPITPCRKVSWMIKVFISVQYQNRCPRSSVRTSAFIYVINKQTRTINLRGISISIKPKSILLLQLAKEQVIVFGYFILKLIL